MEEQSEYVLNPDKYLKSFNDTVDKSKRVIKLNNPDCPFPPVTHSVIKLSDLTERQTTLLNIVSTEVQENRALAGKPPSPHYIVVNMDEPWVDEVIEVLKKHGKWG